MYDNLKKAVEIWGVDMTSTIVMALKDAGSKHLMNEVDYEVLDEADVLLLNILMPKEAYYASEGRAAGKQPPFKAIEKWVAENGIKKEYAYPIAKNIAKFGTKESAIKFLDKFEIDDNLKREALLGYREDVKEKIIEIIK